MLQVEKHSKTEYHHDRPWVSIQFWVWGMAIKCKRSDIREKWLDCRGGLLSHNSVRMASEATRSTVSVDLYYIQTGDQCGNMYMSGTREIHKTIQRFKFGRWHHGARGGRAWGGNVYRLVTFLGGCALLRVINYALGHLIGDDQQINVVDAEHIVCLH